MRQQERRREKIISRCLAEMHTVLFNHFPEQLLVKTEESDVLN